MSEQSLLLRILSQQNLIARLTSAEKQIIMEAQERLLSCTAEQALLLWHKLQVSGYCTGYCHRWPGHAAVQVPHFTPPKK